MKPIHIFKVGTHTSAGGQTLSFTEDMLQASADAYDPKLHEAPIVVGHPQDNGPAFGWIGGVSYSDGDYHADPRQVNDDFAELVAKGTYKKVSASWYAPDAPANPVPGTYYLRHVGFLGAMPPAIKGLDGVEFQEGEEGVIEFSAEWETAGIFRRLREFLIEKFGVEDADKAIPSYMVEGAEDAARMPSGGDDPAFTEPTGDTTMTEQELKDAQAKLATDQAQLATDRAALDADVASFNERQQAADDAAAAARKTLISDTVDALVKKGKVLPAKADAVKAFAEKLAADGVVEFGEGDSAKQEDMTEFFLGMLGADMKGPSFSEHSEEDDHRDDGEDAEGLAKKALEFQESERAAGRTVSITDAVNHVQSQS
ncbi:MAG: peptidase [Pseudomonadota bacterium]